MRTFCKSIFISLIINSQIPGQQGFSLKNDIVRTEEDQSIIIDVTGNDIIVDKSNLIIKIANEPTIGKAVVDGAKIIYTPNLNENGTDEFKYEADVGASSGIATVSVKISPLNDRPEGVSISSDVIQEGKASGTIIGTLNALDPDKNDSFTFELSRENKNDFSISGKDLLSSRVFDFEEEKTFTLTIQVADSKGESSVSTISINVGDKNEAPVINTNKNLSVQHLEDAGKLITKVSASDPDNDQKSVKYRLEDGGDKTVFKITREGELIFLKNPDFEKPRDKDKNNVYSVSYRAVDSKDKTLYSSGSVTVIVMDVKETVIKSIDNRKFVAWSVDHQPYHILMEDAIIDFIQLSGANEKNSIKEMNPTDQIIIVQDKGTNDEIHEIWYGNSLTYTILDREKVDWVFSQDIQKVLVDRTQYLTSDSETVFHENENERLMAGYGSKFSVWHANNFKMSLSSFSMRSNLLQYASNMRVGNTLIGLPGKLGGSSEIGVATQRSEFGFRVPFNFDFGTGNYDEINPPSSDYLGLYARGNIENLFSTKTDFHGLFGFTFYPSSSGQKLSSPMSLVSDSNKWQHIQDSTKNLNILDSYALFATTVEVPLDLSFIGRITAAPGVHYLKVAHRLKDNRQVALDSKQELFERTFYNQKLELGDSNPEYTYEALNEDDESFTSIASFYIRFDVLGQIGEKPNFIERLSLFDFVQISKVPFYEISLQYISGLNMITSVNVNITDDFGFSLTRLSKNGSLKGNWMPDGKTWFGLNYRANF